VATSGTQASYESYFLGQRCDGFAGATFVGPTDGSGIEDTVWDNIETPPDGFVNAGPSSGDVRSCMASLNTQDRWAIGVLSTEVTGSNLTQGAFRMVAVDGAAPTLQNVANSNYQFFMTNTLNRVRDPVFPEAALPGRLDPTDLRRVLVEYVESNIGSPTLLGLLNDSFEGRPWGNGGALAIPDFVVATPGASPATAASMETNPVNTQTRSALGPVNNCSPPITFSGTPGPVLQGTLP
jgi:hypothetical protein